MTFRTIGSKEKALLTCKHKKTGVVHVQTSNGVHCCRLYSYDLGRGDLKTSRPFHKLIPFLQNAFKRDEMPGFPITPATKEKLEALKRSTGDENT